MYSGGNPVFIIVEDIQPVKLLVHVSESYFTKRNEKGTKSM